MDANFKNAWHKHNNKTQKVTCGPIGNYSSAIGITHIDFFSLDVEGSELFVLQTMNWNIQIHYLLVENNLKMLNGTVLLKSHGFRIQEFHHCTTGRGCTSNTLFVNDNSKRPKFSSICLPNIYPDINSKTQDHFKKIYFIIMSFFYLVKCLKIY
jgi:hypothetical protein